VRAGGRKEGVKLRGAIRERPRAQFNATRKQVIRDESKTRVCGHELRHKDDQWVLG
jgi:hypothetical protein